MPVVGIKPIHLSIRQLEQALVSADTCSTGTQCHLQQKEKRNCDKPHTGQRAGPIYYLAPVAASKLVQGKAPQKKRYRSMPVAPKSMQGHAATELHYCSKYTVQLSVYGDILLTSVHYGITPLQSGYGEYLLFSFHHTPCYLFASSHLLSTILLTNNAAI